MTEHQYPITPPPELVEQWVETWHSIPDLPDCRYEYIATQAARWGADAEMRACCEWVDAEFPMYPKSDGPASYRLANARRPKPPSLAEQALENFETISKFALDEYSGCEVYSEYENMVNVILSALKRLQELEQDND